MDNSFGINITTSIFGESHNEYIGATIDGFPAGIEIDYNLINKNLEKRRPKSKLTTTRVEDDEYKIISGVFNDKTTGQIITIIIKNKNINDKVYDDIKDIIRPSHADYSANEKYFGFQDYRGGGHFSGRLTVALVIAGSIGEMLLNKYNIKICSHILSIGDVSDRKFNDFHEDKKLLDSRDYPILSEEIKEEMLKEIENAKDDDDSIGGIVETEIINLPTGIGNPMFRTVESCLSYAIFGIPAIKGIEFGEGFNFSKLKGSLANDSFYIDENKKIKTKTNHNGGINGGITNGMPITFNCVIKPTPSIFKEQESINIKENRNTKLKINGRHDPCIVLRVPIVIESVATLVICDLLKERFGERFFDREVI